LPWIPVASGTAVEGVRESGLGVRSGNLKRKHQTVPHVHAAGTGAKRKWGFGTGRLRRDPLEFEVKGIGKRRNRFGRPVAAIL
jgi:hypothetical protein